MIIGVYVAQTVSVPYDTPGVDVCIYNRTFGMSLSLMGVFKFTAIPGAHFCRVTGKPSEQMPTINRDEGKKSKKQQHAAEAVAASGQPTNGTQLHHTQPHPLPKHSNMSGATSRTPHAIT